MTGTAVERTQDRVEPKLNPITAAEVPSAAWGWSGESPKAFTRAGWFVVVALLAMTIGNHAGRVEDLFLIGFAVVLAGILVRGMVTGGKQR
ncbi:DUF2631 domain-containing protein [Skermania piniformis]|uniref:DUF2631 domain-containing protein n=1 Tax=Skermania pinensis TaxID=39122 RepID=UPI000829E904|nr:DUF2631 domain-containing protein [Skermania piniformis]